MKDVIDNLAINIESIQDVIHVLEAASGQLVEIGKAAREAFNPDRGPFEANDGDLHAYYGEELRRCFLALLGQYCLLYEHCKDVDRELRYLFDYDRESYFCDLPPETVRAAVVDKMLIVRTPHLMSRNRFSRIFRNGKAATYDPSLFLERAIATRIKPFLEQCQYEYKNISILSIFGFGDTAIPDADNLESKHIIDAIASQIIGGDDGYCCSFFNTILQIDDIEPGTYFVGTEPKNVVPSIDTMLEALRSAAR